LEFFFLVLSNEQISESDVSEKDVLQLQHLKEIRELKLMRQDDVNSTFLESSENKAWKLLEETMLPNLKLHLEDLQLKSIQLKESIESTTPVFKRGIKSHDSVQKIYQVVCAPCFLDFLFASCHEYPRIEVSKQLRPNP
jgi:hypothetical protein